MILFEDALRQVLGCAVTFGTETIPFQKAIHRVLATDILSDVDMPPFDKSAMDGFACRRSDLKEELRVVETIPAGVIPKLSIGPGECSRIMTGAIVPLGAGVVIKVEDTELAGKERIRYVGEKTRDNICFLGEDLKLGDLVLEKGTLLGVRHIPILASVGAVQVNVFRQPRVAVLATGTELVEPEEKPGTSKIRNSNAWQMMAQLTSMGIPARYFGIAPDDDDLTRNLFEKVLAENDILVLSGGVSMGDFDFVPEVIQSLGFQIHFNQVSIQPGKPTTFASLDHQFVFGLPGNPVSAYFNLELFVKPFIYKCMDHSWQPLHLRVPAAEDIIRKRANRMGWLPVRLNEAGEAVALEYHGSAHIFTLNLADGMIAMPIGTHRISKGEIVHVRSI